MSHHSTFSVHADFLRIPRPFFGEDFVVPVREALLRAKNR